MKRSARHVVFVVLLSLGVLALAAAVLPRSSQAARGDPPPLSGLVSSTHPVASDWYANRNPAFSWRGVTAEVAGFVWTAERGS